MKILIVGGDKRMEYAAEYLSREFDTERYNGGKLPSERFPVAVLPLPLSKNNGEIYAPNAQKPIALSTVEALTQRNGVVLAGGSDPALEKICEENSLKLHNYFASETLTLRNAALTAEAACGMLITQTDGSLLGEKVLITGYGRIGKQLAARLKALGCEVTVAARRAESRALAELDGFNAADIGIISQKPGAFLYIINTVPRIMFSEREFSKARKGSVYLELASLPEQPTRDAAESCCVRYIFAPGLPGKFSPQKAGEFIAEEIASILRRS